MSNIIKRIYISDILRILRGRASDRCEPDNCEVCRSRWHPYWAPWYRAPRRRFHRRTNSFGHSAHIVSFRTRRSRCCIAVRIARGLGRRELAISSQPPMPAVRIRSTHSRRSGSHTRSYSSVLPVCLDIGSHYRRSALSMGTHSVRRGTGIDRRLSAMTLQIMRFANPNIELSVFDLARKIRLIKSILKRFST